MYRRQLLTLSSALVTLVNSLYVPHTGEIRKAINTDPNGLNNNVLRETAQIAANTTAEDSYLNITQLASKYGYAIEEHRVTTKDGYVLGLHRLMSKNNENNSTRIPVFLMHGLIDSSDSWILQGPDYALGYLLVDNGYDVWMGNARGNKHSLLHTTLNPLENRFWKFSWEEIGVYDLPAMIDYVLNETGSRSLYYVGHSQGTTSFFVMNALKPEYGEKIRTMFALSPVAWMSHAQSPVLKYLSSASTVLQYLQYFVTSPPNFLNQVYGTMCKVVTTGCSNIFELLFGSNYFVSDSMLPVILGHSPTGSSVLQFVHYWQLYDSGKFCRFDYGWMRNLQEYSRLSPPEYDLSNVTVPIVLFSSGNDLLSNPTDVSILESHLPNVYKNYYLQCFSHIDYLYASVAKTAIYMKIVEVIQNFERQR